MSNNLELWESVEKTNPAHTKSITFGRKITAIDPYQQIKNATKKFGPVGIGWGWSVAQVEHLPTNELGILIKMWHTDKSNTFEQWGQASLYIDKAEKKKDTDCLKKATTDGITKCLSFMGFNADIFLGKFDDNKYVQMIQTEFAQAENPDIATISKMIVDKDVKGVKYNWAGLIAKNWGNLSQSQTEDLNHLFNQEG